MKIKSILFIIALLFFITTKAQENLNMNFLSNLSYSQNLSDIWGYSTSIGEYALVGVYDGISIVDVSDPFIPNELVFFSGPNSTWRDLKSWGDYLYCINETGGGLQIVNLSEVLSGNLNPTYIENMNLNFTTAHNIFIDENGVLYVFGSNYGSGGCLMFDLNINPENPDYLGVFDEYYLHDGMVRGDTLWGGAVYNGVFSVVDVSDKANPVIIGTQSTPSNFTHNCWISDNGNYLFTTDEVSAAYVTAYDISDLDNIEELDRIQAWSGDLDVIPHNTHVDGDFLVTSYYTDGVSIVDASHPSNMIEVGYYDTSPGYSGDGFNGAWGAYPWLPSGNILVTDIETGLYVLEPKYSNASFIEGYVTDEITGLPISNVEVQITGSNNPSYTNLSGFYESGMAESGTYEVIFSSPGYSELYETISISSDEILNFDVTLTPFQSFTSEISVLSVIDFVGISGAVVHIYNDDFDYELTTNFNGVIEVSLFEGDYFISIGAWGYVSTCDQFSVSGIEANHTYELDLRYSDDFSLDLDWQVENDSDLTSGSWIREIPNGTSYGWQQNLSIINPDQDSEGDCGEHAFITGNMPNVDAGADDVDGGRTRIISPLMDLTSYTNPVISYETWFQNTGGQGSPPNDSLLIMLSNGLESILIDYRSANSSSEEWILSEFAIEDFQLTSQMQIIVETVDSDPGHLVEAGFDKFMVNGNINLILDEISNSNLIIYPNPSIDGILSFEAKINGCINIYDFLGRSVYYSPVFKGFTSINLERLSSGIYSVIFSSESIYQSVLWIRE